MKHPLLDGTYPFPEGDPKPESETPETDAVWDEVWRDEFIKSLPDTLYDHARSLERRLSLAQAEIEGHMRVEEELKAELREADAAAQRWYLAASPYATPTALREALVEAVKTNEAPQELPEHTDGLQSARVGSSQYPAVASPYALAAMAKLLLAACVDYDGSQEVNGAEPPRIPTCGLLREAADRLAKASARIAELEKADHLPAVIHAKRCEERAERAEARITKLESLLKRSQILYLPMDLQAAIDAALKDRV